MTGKRRKHSAGFKAKVAIAAIKGDRTLAELSEQFGLHANQIQQWKKKLLDESAEIFDAGGSRTKQAKTEVEKLHAKIGQLTMERDFFAKVLDR